LALVHLHFVQVHGQTPSALSSSLVKDLFMNQDNFKLLKDQVAKDLNVNNDNLLSKSIEQISLHRKYLDLFITEYHCFKRLSLEFDKLYKERYHYYKFEQKYNLDSAKEIDSYTKGDDLIYNKSLELLNQEIVTKFLEKTIENIKNMGYAIKNNLEIQKFLGGE
jgi:hypothetical protein